MQSGSKMCPIKTLEAEARPGFFHQGQIPLKNSAPGAQQTRGEVEHLIITKERLVLASAQYESFVQLMSKIIVPALSKCAHNVNKCRYT